MTQQILIRNALAVVTMDHARREIAGGDVLIRDGIVEAVGQGLQAPGAEVVDATGRAIFPGFANIHTHLVMTLARGVFEATALPQPGAQPAWRDRFGQR